MLLFGYFVFDAKTAEQHYLGDALMTLLRSEESGLGQCESTWGSGDCSHDEAGWMAGQLLTHETLSRNGASVFDRLKLLKIHWSIISLGE